jgi:single-strand DNA-binding protein
MNKVLITGRLTKDITLRYTQSQVAVASFGVAIDRGKDKDGNDRGADFPSCIAFGKTAETLEKWSAGKGGRIEIEGHLQTGSYERDGVKRYTTDVIVDRLGIIDWKDRDSSESADNIPDGFEMLDEDLPF